MFITGKPFIMKRILAILILTVSLAACGNNTADTTDDGTAPGEDASGGTTPSITSGNTAARQGQEIPRDSIETSADSTGNIKPGDTTKK